MYSKRFGLSGFKDAEAIVGWSEDRGRSWHYTVFEDAADVSDFAKARADEGKLLFVERLTEVRLEDVIMGKVCDSWTPVPRRDF